MADLNRDGRLDIVVGHVELPGSVYFNARQGKAFLEVSWNDGNGVVYGMAFSDLDGDGWPDIIGAAQAHVCSIHHTFDTMPVFGRTRPIEPDGQTASAMPTDSL